MGKRVIFKDDKEKTIRKSFEKSPQRLFSRLKEKISLIVRNHKGSLHDPLFYLGLISVLFCIFCLSASSTLFAPFLKKGGFSYKETKQGNILSRAAGVFVKNPIENLFIGPEKITLRESPDLLLIQKNSLIACSSPVFIEGRSLGILGDFDNEPSSVEREEIIEYTIKAGDDLISIASQFGISLNTLLWANDLTANSKIRAGESLIILPVSGVLYYVEDGDTVSELALRFKADAKKIIAFNRLAENGEIMRGDILVIPDGIMPISRPVAGQTLSIPLPSSYFLLPVPSSYRMTQGLHWYNAIDFSNGTCGGPIFAAAGGKIQKIGWSRVAGNFIRILHPNNVVTFYGHLSRAAVASGDEVSQGQIIGYIGTTGYSTGCHLHFAVYGAKNPFAK